jgi:hypothetical protein
MATTTSSLDDFERSFDYWSRGGGDSSSSAARRDDDQQPHAADGSLSSSAWNQRSSSVSGSGSSAAPRNGRRRIPNASADGSSSTSYDESEMTGTRRGGDEREMLEFTVTNAADFDGDRNDNEDNDDDDDDEDCAPPTVRSILTEKKKRWLLRKRAASAAAPLASDRSAAASTITPDDDDDDDDAVEIVIREQLSAVYDDVSPDPSCHVEGTISLVRRRHQQHPQPQGGSAPPFCLTMRDVLGQLDRVDPNDDVCQNVSDRVSRQGLHRLDRVLRVRLPQPPSDSDDDHDDEGRLVRLATYHSSIRPVPLVRAPGLDKRMIELRFPFPFLTNLISLSQLVKSRVQVAQAFSRAGFKIRANPSNEYPLTGMVIMLAVPPYVKGSSARMSRPGGTWNEMKRVISWDVDRLEPGEAMEVQLQFESMDGTWDREPKFPVLVRADCPRLFTSLELRSDFSDGLSRLVGAAVSTSARVLHRKV